MTRTYVPDRGDVVWCDFSPRVGREQSGVRPAIVVSPIKYNSLTGLAICCPITSKVKGYGFEVELSESSQIQGVVLADHIKSLDWRVRSLRFIERASEATISDVIAKSITLLQP